ncbi:unnamed protein product [Mycena citricolor]|uniref:Uncharacterized protein n=1 Tax=Mycena citricolor TaxID=2018698 RepID=A0AAD2HQ45_9AGAR|nr:unnamed protein product [Mycena citricolor]
MYPDGAKRFICLACRFRVVYDGQDMFVCLTCCHTWQVTTLTLLRLSRILSVRWKAVPHVLPRAKMTFSSYTV